MKTTAAANAATARPAAARRNRRECRISNYLDRYAGGFFAGNFHIGFFHRTPGNTVRELSAFSHGTAVCIFLLGQRVIHGRNCRGKNSYAVRHRVNQHPADGLAVRSTRGADRHRSKQAIGIVVGGPGVHDKRRAIVVDCCLVRPTTSAPCQPHSCESTGDPDNAPSSELHRRLLHPAACCVSRRGQL